MKANLNNNTTFILRERRGVPNYSIACLFAHIMLRPEDPNDFQNIALENQEVCVQYTCMYDVFFENSNYNIMRLKVNYIS